MKKLEKYILFVVFLMGIVVFAAADEAAAAEPQPLQQGRIKGEWILPPHYPDGFDGIGMVNRIGEGEIVIDDCLYRLRSGLQCATFRKRSASIEDFRVGMQVGFLKSSDRAIVSLWSLEPRELEHAEKGFAKPPGKPAPAPAVNRPPSAP